MTMDVYAHNRKDFPERFRTPLTFTKQGKPVYLIGGGDETGAPTNEPPAPAQPDPDARFTAEDIEAARKQEKDKVYGRLSEVTESNKALAEQVQALLAESQARKEAEEQMRQEAEEAARKAAEAEMSAAELIAAKEAELQAKIVESQQTWEQRFAEMQAQREAELAASEKERELATLQAYTQQQVAAAQDQIAPELVEFIGGNTQEEIDASIQRVIAKSAEIAASAAQALGAQRQQERGVSVAAGSSGPLEAFSTGQRQYSAQEIRDMPMSEYIKFRQQAGIGNSQGNGLYS